MTDNDKLDYQITRQALTANIARALGISKHVAVMKTINKLIDDWHSHSLAQAVVEAQIDELYEAIDTPVSNLPTYLTNRIAELTKKKGQSE